MQTTKAQISLSFPLSSVFLLSIISVSVPPDCAVSYVRLYPSYSASLTQHSGASDIIQSLTFLPLVSSVVLVLSSVMLSFRLSCQLLFLLSAQSHL